MIETFARVNYSETDQMGVVYHSRYLVWLDVARCEYIRQAGVSYAELERRGFRLAVGELRIRYRQPARYDDLVRVRCWVRDAVSRRITFGYLLDLPDRAVQVATAETAMMVLNAELSLARLPDEVFRLLTPEPDPVRLF
ncbi:MAG: acyl-CoA thioesterase [Gemmatimonadales bacterium]